MKEVYIYDESSKERKVRWKKRKGRGWLLEAEERKQGRGGGRKREKGV